MRKPEVGILAPVATAAPGVIAAPFAPWPVVLILGLVGLVLGVVGMLVQLRERSYQHEENMAAIKRAAASKMPEVLRARFGPDAPGQPAHRHDQLGLPGTGGHA
ncbi:hypothetical protein GCM10029964_120800 [Kibdelosporangium lantanae]